MNYSAIIKKFAQEALSYKQYKRLPTAVAVLAVIATLPFLLLAALTFVFFHCYNFFYNLISSSVSYLEAWLRRERQNVHPATEAVLYLVATPFIFFIRVILSGFAAGFFFLWFGLQCYSYVFTLGGVRFQPYINSATFSGESASYRMKTSTTVSTVLVGISFGLYALSYVLMLVSYLTDPYYSPFYALSFIALGLYYLFTVIAAPFHGFKAAGEELPAAAEAEGEGEDAVLAPAAPVNYKRKAKIVSLASLAIIFVATIALIVSVGLGPVGNPGGGYNPSGSYYPGGSSTSGFSSATSVYSGTGTSVYSSSGAGRYYRFSPTYSDTYTLYSTGNSDVKVTLYDSNYNQITWDDDGGENYNFRLSYSFSAYTTYYIVVEAYGGGSFDTTLYIERN